MTLPRHATRPNLRISGPTPLPDAVREAGSRQMLSHRSEPFREMLRDVLDRLRPVFGTRGSVLPFTCSGTGGLEAAVVNAVAPGDAVLGVSIGHFGERFAEVAEAHAGVVERLSLPWGEAADPDEVRRRVRRRAPAAVLITHNETSTGVINPLADLCRAVREESDALVLVDAVSSAGAVALEMDRWGADAIVTVTQKALMAPPGLALVAVSDRFLAAAGRHANRRLYFDVPRMAAAVAEGTTTYTPAVGVIHALDVALAMLEEEGLDAAAERHRRIAAACREGLQRHGLSPVAAPADASPTVTAARVGAGRSATTVRRRLEEEHAVFVATGRGPWKDDVIRVGHLGHVTDADVEAVVDAVGAVLAS